MEDNIPISEIQVRLMSTEELLKAQEAMNQIVLTDYEIYLYELIDQRLAAQGK